jgi:hypothetical protein
MGGIVTTVIYGSPGSGFLRLNPSTTDIASELTGSLSGCEKKLRKRARELSRGVHRRNVMLPVELFVLTRYCLRMFSRTSGGAWLESTSKLMAS